MADDLHQLVTEIEAASGEVGPFWGRAHRLLLKSRTPNDYAGRVIMNRDLDALRSIADALAAGEVPTEAVDETPTVEIPEETLNKAFKMFRKRIEVTRLNEESRLSVSPLTGGKKSEVMAMQPPREFPKTVWDELVRQERLRYAGDGFYELR